MKLNRLSYFFYTHKISDYNLNAKMKTWFKIFIGKKSYFI